MNLPPVSNEEDTQRRETHNLSDNHHALGGHQIADQGDHREQLNENNVVHSSNSTNVTQSNPDHGNSGSRTLPQGNNNGPNATFTLSADQLNHIQSYGNIVLFVPGERSILNYEFNPDYHMNGVTIIKNKNTNLNEPNGVDPSGNNNPNLNEPNGVDPSGNNNTRSSLNEPNGVDPSGNNNTRPNLNEPNIVTRPNLNEPNGVDPSGNNNTRPNLNEPNIVTRPNLNEPNGVDPSGNNNTRPNLNEPNGVDLSGNNGDNNIERNQVSNNKQKNIRVEENFDNLRSPKRLNININSAPPIDCETEMLQTEESLVSAENANLEDNDAAPPSKDKDTSASTSKGPNNGNEKDNDDDDDGADVIDLSLHL